MTNYSATLLSGEELTGAEKQDFEQNPEETLQALFNDAQSGGPDSSSAVDALAALTRPEWPEAIQSAAVNALLDAFQGRSELIVLGKLNQLDHNLWWQPLMDRVLQQKIETRLELVIVPLLFAGRKDDTRSQLIQLAQDRARPATDRNWGLDALSWLARAPQPNDAQAREVLVQNATDEENPAEVLAFAVQALTRIEARGFTDRLGPMIRLNQDPTLLTRLLDYMEMSANPDSLPYLRQLTNARDPLVRKQLIVILNEINNRDVVGLLRDVLRFERENDILREAVNTLQGLGNISESVEPLAGVATNTAADPSIRLLAVKALGENELSEAADALIETLDKLQDDTLENRVLEILAEKARKPDGSEIARAALLKAIIHPNGRIRQQARVKISEGLSPEERSGEAGRIIEFLRTQKRISDPSAKSIADLLLVLITDRAERTQVAEQLRDMVLESDYQSCIYVLRDFVGVDPFAALFTNTLDPLADPPPEPPPLPEHIKRAENALMEVPSERGIEILVRYRIERSRKDRRERLGLVATGETSPDGTSEDVFRRLRESGVKIFEDTATNRAKGAYNIMLTMNVASFVLVFSFTLICLYYAFVANPEESGDDILQLVAGGGALLGGLLTVIQARLFVPVRAVQDSIANLSMVQMTFMGFISRLEQVRVVFQDLYLNSQFDVENLQKTDAVLQDLVKDALGQLNQFVNEDTKNQRNANPAGNNDNS